MDTICGIYKIENKINHKVYIGQSVDIYTRWYNHKHDLLNGVHYNSHLQKSWNKYGEENFNFSIIEKCSQDSLDALETQYISDYKSYDREFGYNLSFGGAGGGIPTNETRQKLSAVNSGKNNPMYGKHHSEETKEKIRQMKLGEKNAMFGKRGELSPSYKKKHTDEFKLLQSELHKGKPLPEETRAKQKAAKLGQNNPMSKAVYCIELDEYFWGAQDAQNKYGISRDGISKCCRDKQQSAGRHPLTGEKLHWVYVDEWQVAV